MEETGRGGDHDTQPKTLLILTVCDLVYQLNYESDFHLEVNTVGIPVKAF